MADVPGGLRRFDARLDAHLRRRLSPEDHDRVSTSVKSVASLTGDIQHKHRYVILGHRCIFLAEVPPKNLKVAVQLRDLHSVEMLDDLPVFLKPKESENTVHVRLQYHKKPKEKSDVLSSITKQSPSIFRRATEASPTPSVPFTPPSSPPTCNSSRTFSGNRSKSLSPKSPLLLTTKFPLSSSRPLPSLPANLSPNNPPSSSLHGNFTGVTNDELSAQSHKTPSLEVSPHQLASHHRSRSINTLAILSSSPRVTHRSSSSTDLFASSPLVEPKRQLDMISLADALGLSTEQETVVPDKPEMGVLDLYILQHESDFYHQLSVAWDNWNIHQLCNIGETQQQHPRSPLLQRDQFSQRYVSLKQELLQCGDRFEVAAGLALELSTAAQRYSLIKPLFWEDSDLLDFCVSQLATHLNLKHSIQLSTADRIEYSVILLDMLYQMLKETYHIKRKLVVLTRNAGLPLVTLANVIVNNPFKTSSPELAPFEREVVEKSSAILYELFQVCLQTRWPEADKTSLVFTKVVDDIIQLPGSMVFLEGLTGYVCDVIGPKSAPVIEVTGGRRMSLHHAGFILHCLTDNCSHNSLRLIKTCLGDNFRYYVSVSRCKQVLSLGTSNPLSRKTVSFLQTVKSRIAV